MEGIIALKVEQALDRALQASGHCETPDDQFAAARDHFAQTAHTHTVDFQDFMKSLLSEPWEVKKALAVELIHSEHEKSTVQNLLTEVIRATFRT